LQIEYPRVDGVLRIMPSKQDDARDVTITATGGSRCAT
jgi:hypothetical protein